MNAPVAEFLASPRSAPALPPHDSPVALGQPVPVTVAHGDGIGPEIMAATLAILRAAGARLAPEPVELGAPAVRAGRHGRHRRGGLGVAAPDPGAAQGARHHALGRRLQEPQRHAAQDARPLRQRPALRFLPPVRRDPASGHERRHRARERGRPLRRDRAPSDGGRGRMPEAGQRARHRADRPLRVRVRARARPAQGHLHDQGQHHEADRRPVQQHVPPDRRGVSGPRAGAPDHRHRHRDDGRRARALRRRGDTQPLRRHPLRRRGAGGRLGRHGGVRQHRRCMPRCSRRSTARRRTSPGAASPTRPACSRPR